ncbi:MAG: peptidoglycan-binding protein [Cyanobacteriota bacterium]|nr:peptidoglycan-binding protein [Cyanobacteriota bacterium]
MTATQSTRSKPSILRRGSRGDLVKHVQTQLNSILKVQLIIDGVFGALTEAAVEQFQSRYGLTVDGIAGLPTQTLLDNIWSAPLYPLPTLRLGRSGEEVRYLQALLHDFGYAIAADGRFGPNTEAALKQFQRRYGLLVDGIAGRNTWSLLQFQFHD